MLIFILPSLIAWPMFFGTNPGGLIVFGAMMGGTYAIGLH